MSKTIYESGNLELTQYCAGRDKGSAIQISTDIRRYITLSRKQVREVAKELERWLEDTEPEAFIEEL